MASISKRLKANVAGEFFRRLDLHRLRHLPAGCTRDLYGGTQRLARVPAAKRRERGPSGEDGPRCLSGGGHRHQTKHALYYCGWASDYRNRFLFSGDHLWWDSKHEHVVASRRVCWYGWNEQIASMERLTAYSFEWLLPGHGMRCRLKPKSMGEELGRCVRKMK